MAEIGQNEARHRKTVVRARFANAVALLGSATPSLESFANVERGKIRLLSLPERIDGRPLPVVEIVDLNEGKPTLFSPPLLDALAATRARREQSIVFLNCRGHTRVVECEDCGVTLPGDPMPGMLPTAPFDENGNIVCDAP